MKFRSFRRFLLLFPAGSLLAAAPECKALELQDSSYIRSLRNHPHFTFELARRMQSIQIRNPANESQVIRYEPNSLSNFLVSFDYRWLSLSLGLLRLKVDPAKGNTSQFSLRASFNGKRIWNTNFLQAFQGFYLANPQQVDPQWTTQAGYTIRPDIATLTLFSNIDYCFSPERFSYRAALWQLDRQERSAGSFIAGASYRFNLMMSDTSQTLIPPQLLDGFSISNRIIAQRIVNLSFHGGYIHTFVLEKNWFLTLYFLPGISFQGGQYYSEDKLLRNYRSKLTGASEIRIIAGYNGEKWFTGLSSHTLSFSGNKAVNMWVDNQYSWFRLFAGFRLKAVNREKRNFLRKIGL